MDNWHDEQARRHQQDADAHWGAGSAGSIDHWNSIHAADRAHQEADWQRLPPAAPAWTGAGAVSTPWVGSGTGGAWQSGRSDPVDDSQIGAVFWGLFKSLALTALGLALLAGALWLAAVQAERHWAAGRPGGGLGRLAAGMAFSGAELSPPERYASAEAAAAPAPIRPKAKTAVKANAAATAGAGAQAYRCQVDAECASAAVRAGRSDADLWKAAAFLAERARGGDERAAGDLCLLPLLAGSTGRSAGEAPTACAAALRAAPKSKIASERARIIASSWWVRAAAFFGPLIES